MELGLEPLTGLAEQLTANPMPTYVLARDACNQEALELGVKWHRGLSI